MLWLLVSPARAEIWEDSPKGNLCYEEAITQAEFDKAFELAYDVVSSDFANVPTTPPVLVAVCDELMTKDPFILGYYVNGVIFINRGQPDLNWYLDRVYTIAHEMVHYLLDGIDVIDHCLIYEPGGYEEQILARLGMPPEKSREEFGTRTKYFGSCVFDF